MPTPRLSPNVRDALADERESVAARLTSLREQSERLHTLTETVDREVEETSRLLRQMDEMLGRAPQMSIHTLDGDLRGQQLQEVAVELLRTRTGVEAIHYREWFKMVCDAGFRVSGKDPLAAFLTQVSRADNVESVRPRSGLYRLRAA